MIAIRLVSPAAAALSRPLEAVFGEAGGDIGRAPECTLVLPDPERRISRKHLQVACRDGAYFLRLISTNLLVELDGVPLAPGAEFALHPGAQVRIGPFLLLAEDRPVAGHAPGARPSLDPKRAAAVPRAEDPLGLLSAAERSKRPSVFHDLLHPVAAEPAAGAPEPRPAAQELDLEIGEPTGANAVPAPAAALLAAAPAEALVEALYAGLQIAAPEPATRSAAQAELIGALLRAAVGGTLDLLATRAIAKRELGASQTMIQTHQNNPLKFAADTNAALAQLLGPRRRGFVPPLTAMHDAFDDLRAHEVALLAGMRAALEAVLERFDPRALEAGLADHGVWDKLRLANHKASLWDRFVEQHGEIVREIEGNFDSTFAGAFLAAYEAQLARLSRPA